ncbi:MAG: dockerin type I domain-containing protein, partial [Planctomycetota bacterium]
TLIISDAISDVAGNALDGESNASGPLESPELPSGDGVPGGEFVARFTIDSRPEIATWSQGVVYADINGNFVWDPEGQDNDATNRDFVFNFGEITDAYFTGNFSDVASIGADNIQGTADDGLAPSNGFDKLGAYGSFSQTVTPTEVDYMFLLDTDDDGVGDTFGTMAYQVNAIPVAGNFFSSDADLAAIANGARPRDEIGAFDGTYWYLDTDGDNEIELGERFIVQGLPNGIPIVGDFNGDGSDDLATFDNDTGIFSFALIDPVDSYVGGPNVIGFDQIDPETLVNGVPFGFIFSGFGERPVSADVNLDGVDDLVMWVPDRDGQVPMASGEFHFLVSDRVDDNNAVTLPSSLFDPYSPEPLGNDLFAQFGDEFALPLIGNFDPPVAKGDDTDDDDTVSPLTNHSSPLDTNVDGSLTAADALVVINALPRSDSFDYSNLESLMATMGQNRLDANGDGVISAADALRVINGLARQVAQAEGESDAWAANVDGVIAMSDDDEDLLGVLALDQERDRVK